MTSSKETVGVKTEQLLNAFLQKNKDRTVIQSHIRYQWFDEQCLSTGAVDAIMDDHNSDAIKQALVFFY